MPAPLDFDELNWSNVDLAEVPTLIVHSAGDEEIPLKLTEAFAVAHPTVTVVETERVPHGWEANVDPERFRTALTSSWV